MYGYKDKPKLSRRYIYISYIDYIIVIITINWISTYSKDRVQSIECCFSHERHEWLQNLNRLESAKKDEEEEEDISAYTI